MTKKHAKLPSRQRVSMYGQLLSGARWLLVCLSLHLHLFIVYVNSEDSGKTVQNPRLI